ncbi:MAG: hypothetical protein ACJ8BW_00645 [Ktedonobacteraceae bacterium]
MSAPIIDNNDAAPIFVTTRTPPKFLHRRDCPYFEYVGALLEYATIDELRTLPMCAACERIARNYTQKAQQAA